MDKRWTTAVLLLSFLPGYAEAASAPAQLRGKSVIVAWSENRMQRFVGESEFHPRTVQHEFRVYVSSAGRVFSRITNTNQRGMTGSKDEVGGEKGSNRIPDFSGQSMIIVMAGASRGARRIAVAFGAGFESCTADIVRAKEVGASTMISASTIMKGRMTEIKSVTTSAASCRVQAGNVFGGGQ